MNDWGWKDELRWWWEDRRRDFQIAWNGMSGTRRKAVVLGALMVYHALYAALVLKFGC